MLLSESRNYIILNGSCIHENHAKIPAITSGLYYGAGCFETFIADQGRIFKFDEHIDRLNRGLKYLGVSDSEIADEKTILQQIKILLTENDLLGKRSRIRIQISLADKGGYSKSNDSSLIVIISSHLAEKKTQPKKLIVSGTSVIPSSARPSSLKLSNMLHYRQAFREACMNGADDAVMQTVDEFVAETSIANIFWMKNGQIFTPSITCDILPGIMRDSIIEIIKNKMKLNVIEGKFVISRLTQADYAWLTNSVMEFVPVSTIAENSFQPNSDFLSDLQRNLEAYMKENMQYV